MSSAAPRRLGRGLEALLGQPAARPGLSLHNPDAEKATGEPLKVSVYEIDRNPWQPRKEFDDNAIAELADSLEKHGMLQPLTVRKRDDRYQLIAGERRLRAAIKAGWSDVPVQVRECNDRMMCELAIVENLQRRDLNALEKAQSFQVYLQSYQCTQEDMANRLALERTTISNLMRLLELPAGVQDSLRAGMISAGHARALLPLGDEREQTEYCRKIQSEGWSVRLTEQRVQDFLDGEESSAKANPAAGIGVSNFTASSGAKAAPATATKDAKKKSGRTRSSQIAALEGELRQALGTKIEIRQSSRGQGKITIHFASAPEFDRLRQYLIGE